MAVDNQILIELTADIVTAHVSHNPVSVESLGGVIQSVFSALQGLGAPVEPEEAKPVGAVSVRASIKPGHLVSMIDGRQYKTLKRHLSRHGHTPESYRQAYNLPRDYPMVAAEYAEKRRNLAVQLGLGRKRKAEAKPARKPRVTKGPAKV